MLLGCILCGSASCAWEYTPDAGLYIACAVFDHQSMSQAEGHEEKKSAAHAALATMQPGQNAESISMAAQSPPDASASDSPNSAMVEAGPESSMAASDGQGDGITSSDLQPLQVQANLGPHTIVHKPGEPASAEPASGVPEEPGPSRAEPAVLQGGAEGSSVNGASLSQMDGALWAQLPANVQQELLCQPEAGSEAHHIKQVRLRKHWAVSPCKNLHKSTVHLRSVQSLPKWLYLLSHADV
jgi:hypothetical protein